MQIFLFFCAIRFDSASVGAQAAAKHRKFFFKLFSPFGMLLNINSNDFQRICQERRNILRMTIRKPKPEAEGKFKVDLEFTCRLVKCDCVRFFRLFAKTSTFICRDGSSKARKNAEMLFRSASGSLSLI